MYTAVLCNCSLANSISQAIDIGLLTNRTFSLSYFKSGYADIKTTLRLGFRLINFVHNSFPFIIGILKSHIISPKSSGLFSIWFNASSGLVKAQTLKLFSLRTLNKLTK